MNMPRPSESLTSNLKDLTEPMYINGQRIYEPFFDHCWKCLKFQPLTIIKMKCSKEREMLEMTQKCTEILMQSVDENEIHSSSLLRALQLRLIRIIYKRDLYSQVLSFQQTAYEYREKMIEVEKAKKQWKQAVNYTKRVNGDHILVSKVRQNKAFMIRRSTNINQYGRKNSQDGGAKTRYEEREQECKLNYTLAKDIANKLLMR